MTEEQIPLYVLIASLIGCFAGAWTGRSILIGGTVLLVAIGVDITSWMIYGFTVNWQPSWGGIGHIVFGVLYAGPGMTLYATVPAAVGFVLSVFVVRILVRTRKPSDTTKRT